MLKKMSLEEKLGQTYMINIEENDEAEYNLSNKEECIRKGEIGWILNVVDPSEHDRYQKIAIEESRLGIPLLFTRDIVHGFKTIFPIPLGQGATWNTDLVRKSSSITASEASLYGIDMTFSPVLEVCRDPRWGRIAESYGEDPYLVTNMSLAAIEGYQGNDLSKNGQIAACAKHFVGYSAAEDGRDYNSTFVDERTLRDIHFPPFENAVKAGVSSIMTAHTSLNGIPVTGDSELIKGILREKWGFNGLVISDFFAISYLINFGICRNSKEAALISLKSTIDVEMVSNCYLKNVKLLIDEGLISMEEVDQCVERILELKFKLGLFEDAYVKSSESLENVYKEAEKKETAYQLALESIVLLKNSNNILPLSKVENKKIAIIGYLADSKEDMNGCWCIDGDNQEVVTPLEALKNKFSKNNLIRFCAGVEDCRSKNEDGFESAIEICKEADYVIIFLGEDAKASGEAKSRAFLNVPGSQEKLFEKIISLGKKVITVICSGRPLELSNISEKSAAVLYAWHPGVQGGNAITDIICGAVSPSGKLPVCLPRAIGQIPIYYSKLKLSRPGSSRDTSYPMGQIVNTTDWSSKFSDVDISPLYQFGYGLTYCDFKLENLNIITKKVKKYEDLIFKVSILNRSKIYGKTVVQVYINDCVASVVRPVKELKAFQKLSLEPLEKKTIEFQINTKDFGFHNREMKYCLESGTFKVMVGLDSTNLLEEDFEIL